MSTYLIGRLGDQAEKDLKHHIKPLVAYEKVARRLRKEITVLSAGDITMAHSSEPFRELASEDTKY